MFRDTNIADSNKQFVERKYRLKINKSQNLTYEVNKLGHDERQAEISPRQNTRSVCVCVCADVDAKKIEKQFCLLI